MKNMLLALLMIFSMVITAQDIPDIIIKDIEGSNVSVHNLINSDDIKIFSFWATWCVPCINELDAISDVYEEWKEETNVELIAISTDDARTKKRVKPLINGKDWDFKILLDENQEFKRALNINVLPYVIIIQKGKIIHTRTGYTQGSEDELYEIVKEHTK